ncbi:GtrA family protein [Erythrobacter litoralis]|uniref:GtrA family protein n=1 Tax=Erythrobacter litoralis TaxID=39960 RepID=UPI002435AD65|nr:GtrA family protein [Erythrobacter litoralis]MDG6079370.1 GtrA family protein [Erythrobacter litoralis]
MFDWRDRHEWLLLWRYYQAGIVNTLFGYGFFAVLVWTGLNIYVAQVIAHVGGTVFNYVTYSRYTFRSRNTPVGRFVVSYALNYLLSVVFLFGFEQVFRSPYLSGLGAVLVVSALNFLVLKRFVFNEKEAG